MLEFKGSKAGSSTTNTADNLFATDNVEAILAISEGPIAGLENGANSFLVGETNLTDNAGKSNFEKFQLVMNLGSPSGEVITSRLGGFGSSVNVGTALVYNTPVVRNGSQTNFDFVDIRGVVNRLYASGKKGTFGHSVQVRIEYRQVGSSGAWTPASSATAPPDVQAFDNTLVYQDGREADISVPYYFDITNGPALPSVYVENDIHLLTGGSPSYRPYRVVNGSWIDDYLSAVSIGVPSVTGYNLKTKGRLFITTSSAQTWSDIMGALAGKILPYDIIFDLPLGIEIMYNGSTWVGVNRPGEPILNQIGGGAVIPPTGPTISDLNGVVKVSGKTSTAYVREIRFQVPRSNTAYQYRITKLSPDTKTENETEYATDISWESFQEIAAKQWIFPNLATVQLLAQASGQFSSLPDMSGIYKGRTIKVPTNYNPVTKVYTGVWDGTWKIAWTSNPAFIVKDLVENDRYGMNAYYPVVLDDSSVYLAGQHCDQYEFSFNALLAESRLGKEAINYICGMFGGRFVDDGNGYAKILLDRNTNAIYQFAAENVEDGIFSYSFTEISSRYNDVTVTFTNPDLNWAEDRVRVFDAAHIAKYGHIPNDFIAVGCTDKSEAIRRGRLHMITATTERAMVNFKTNRQGLYLEPYNIIQICDETMNTGQSGRVVTRNSNTRLTLRDNVYLEAGTSYKLFLSSGSTFDLKEFVITGPTGSTNYIDVATTLPTDIAALNTVVTIGVVNGITPKAWRVISIEETDDPDKVSISAIEVNRTKWDFVMTGVSEPAVDQTGLGIETLPTPPTNLQTSITTRTYQNRLAQDLQLTWLPPSQRRVRGFNVYTQLNGGNIQFNSFVNTEQFELQDITASIIRLGVSTVNLNGLESPISWTEHDTIGFVPNAPAPGNLRLVNGSSSTAFEVSDPQIAWDTVSAPWVTGYEIRVINDDNSALLYTTTTVGEGTTFRYPVDLNRKQNGGTNAVRALRFSVSAKTSTNLNGAASTLTVTNAAPATVSFTAVNDIQAFLVSITPPAINDLAGYRVWASQTPAFAYDDSNLVYDGPDNMARVRVGFGTWYVRAAAYDTFGKTGLNVSGTVTVLVTDFVADTTAPDVPTGLDLTTSLVTSSTGLVTAKIRATVNANAASNFSYNEFEIRESGGNYVSFQTSEVGYEWTNLLPNQAHDIRVRSRSKADVASVYCTVGSITTPAKTTGPAAPTSLAAVAGFRSIFLTWTNPTDSDLTGVEVWANTVNTRPDPATQASMRLGIASGSTFTHTMASPQTTFYWVRGVNTSKIAGAWNATSGVSGTPALVASTDLTAGSVDFTKFASGIEPVSMVTSLPTPSGYSGPKTVFNTTDGKLYRYVSGAWTTAQAASDIAGQIQSAQIADSAIGATKIASGLTLVANGGALPNPATWTGSKLFQLDTDGKVYRLVSGAWVATTAAGDISGTLVDAQIAAVAAAKVTGQLTDDQLAAIAATKITGTLATAQIANAAITTAKFASDIAPISLVSSLPTVAGYTGPSIVFLSTDSRLYRFTGSAWTLETRAADISGTLTSAQIADLAAAKLTGQIVSTQITDNAVTTAKINAGAVVTASLAAGAVTAAKIAADTITANEIAAGAINATELATDSVIAGKVAAAAINTRELATQAVTTAKIFVGDNTNAVLNGNFLGPDGNVSGDCWALASGAALSQDNGVNDRTRCRVVATKRSSAYSNFVQTSPNETWFVQASFYNQATEAASIWVEFFDANGNYISGVTNGYANEKNQWAKVEGTFTVPAGAVNMRVLPFVDRADVTSGSWHYWTDVRLRRAMTGEMVVDGAITAGKIAAGSVTTPKLAAGAVTANEIAANAVTTAKINAGAVVTASIAAGAVTAGKIATDTITANEIAANAITSTELAVDSVIVGKVAAGAIRAREIDVAAITAEKLAVGTGNNLVYNSDLLVVTSNNQAPGWSFYASSGVTLNNARAEVGGNNRPPGCNSIVVSASGTPSGNMDTFNTRADGTYYPVLPNRRYEVSSWISSHRCVAYVNCWVYDENGNYIVEYAGTQFDSNFYSIGTPPDIARSWVITPTLPTNARFVLIGARAILNGRSDPYLFASQFFLAEAQPNQITPSQWTPSSATLINGNGILARTIESNRIIANSITASELAAASVTAGKVAAGVITSTELASDSVTTGKIAAAAINAREISAGAITAEKAAFGISKNQVYNSDCLIIRNNIPLGWEEGWRNFSGLTSTFSKGFAPYHPVGMESVCLYYSGSAPSGVNDIYNKPQGTNLTHHYPVFSGQRYEFSVTVSAHRCSVNAIIVIYDKDGNYITEYGGSSINDNQANSNSGNNFPRIGVITPALPSNSARALLVVRSTYTGISDPYTFVTAAYFAPANPNQTQLSPYSTGSATIIDGAGIIAETVTADKIVAGSITSDRVQAGTLTGDRLNVNTTLPATITVGSTGVQIGTIEARASDPASRVNAASTQIDPGKILISGGTSLAHWRDGSNNAEISGGSIAANTVSANKLRIGSRGIRAVNIDFTPNAGANTVSWTAGYILYNNDSDTVTLINISSGSASYSGSYVYIYWTQNSSTFAVTSTLATAMGANSVLVAIYRGGAAIEVMVGSTIIDGTRIVTGSIVAGQIAAGAITTPKIASGAVTANEVAAGAITTSKLAAGAVTANEIGAGAITAAKLSVGVNTNMVPNSDFLGGLSNQISTWTNMTNGMSVAPITSGAYAPPGMASVRISSPGANGVNQIAYYDVGTLTSSGVTAFPIIPGQRYEVSAYLSIHRCYGVIRIAFWDVNNNYITDATSSWFPSNYAQNQLNNWSRAAFFVTAPTNAAKAWFGCVQVSTGESNGDAYFTGLFMAPAQANQTQASDWANGAGTVINGGQIVTGSVTADRINVASLSAITATIGHLRTATTGARMELLSDKILVYDASNVLRVRIGNLVS